MEGNERRGEEKKRGLAMKCLISLGFSLTSFCHAAMLLRGERWRVDVLLFLFIYLLFFQEKEGEG